ncbi:MAG: penicillin-binding protein 2 [Patescibacteria group bacterium]
MKHKLTQEEAGKIREKKMPGVELIPESWRNYPEGELASQVLGFVGYKDDKRMGQYGIEAYYDDILEGTSGFVKAEKDTAGRWISISKRTLERPKNGTDVVLTLDQSVQYFVEKLLKESIEKYGAASGSVIVIDPRTGKIAAMANYPTFNSNEFNKVEDKGAFKNRCISDQYEPGSAFKPMNASIGLDLGKLTPESTYNDTGSFSVAGYTIRNSDGKAYGKISLTRFLELSLNTGAIWAMQSASKENFLKYLKNYGFGKKTGVELLGEADGDIENLDYMRDVNFVTASFGQGISLTPLQLATAFSTVVNGGILMRPRIVEKFLTDDGKEEIVEPKEIRRVISSKTSSTMRAMLISVVKNGWGKKAGVPGYLIGGKTGTAQMPGPSGGYSDKTIHNFVGFGPGDDPKFVTLVKLDEVTAVNFAADSVALVTGKLNKFLLDYYNIFPTEEIKEDELIYFNRLMELKEEDIKKAKESDEGAEGIMPINSGDDKKKSDDKKKDKKKDKD